MHRRSFLKGSAALLGAAVARGQGTAPAIAQAPDELVFCDFNAGAETWSCEGEAFAQTWLNPDRYPRDPNAPFRGQIVGVEGDGYLSSTNPTARLKALGRVTSPEFTVERPYIHLKVGGYNQPGLSGVQLLIDGQPVRTASGFGTATQGYHKLRPVVWDVRELQGKPARIEVYDRASTSFVMVDSIVFSTSDQMRYRELPDVVAIDAGIQDWLERKVDAALAVGTNPAVASCIVAGGKIVARVAKGERKAGSGVAVELDDAFQLGSGSKPVTGTLAAVAVEEGILDWTTTIKDIFPELPPHPYEDVTVAQLGAHLGGFPRNPTGDKEDHFTRLTDDIRERFYHFTRVYVQEAPLGPPGKTGNYGCGMIVVTSLLARLTGLSHDAMLQQWISEPLGLTAATSRAAVKPEEDPAVACVWQHGLADGRPVPGAPVGYQYPMDLHGPTGGVNMSVTDVGKYIIAHMPEGAGPRLVTDATLEKHHSGAGGIARSPKGWPPEDWVHDRGIRLYAHNGSNGANYFQHYILPDVRIGFTVMTNSVDNAPIGLNALEPFFYEVLPELLKRA